MLEITATGVVTDSNSILQGIFGIDLDLGQLSTLLQQVFVTQTSDNATSTDESSWAYIVERQGSNTGKYVASTTDPITVGDIKLGLSVMRVGPHNSTDPAVRLQLFCTFL